MEPIPVIDFMGREGELAVKPDGSTSTTGGVSKPCMYPLNEETRELSRKRIAALEAYRAADAELESHRIYDNTTRLPPEAYAAIIGTKVKG